MQFSFVIVFALFFVLVDELVMLPAGEIRLLNRRLPTAVTASSTHEHYPSLLRILNNIPSCTPAVKHPAQYVLSPKRNSASDPQTHLIVHNLAYLECAGQSFTTLPIRVFLPWSSHKITL